jgi:hypothetical protein
MPGNKKRETASNDERKDCGRRVQEGFSSQRAQGVADAALNMDMDAKSQGGPIPWTSERREGRNGRRWLIFISRRQ